MNRFKKFSKIISLMLVIFMLIPSIGQAAEVVTEAIEANDQASIQEIEELLDKAEASTTVAEATGFINQANKEIKKLADGEVKTRLTKRMNDLASMVALWQIHEYYITQEFVGAVSRASTAQRAQRVVDGAQARINEIQGGYDKTNLQRIVDDQQLVVDEMANKEAAALAAVVKAEETKKQEDVDEARALVEQLPNSKEKTALLARLDLVQEEIDNVKEVKVTLDLNGGKVKEGQEIEFTLNVGEEFTIPHRVSIGLEKQGYTFKGWINQNTGENLGTSSRKVIITEDTVFKAEWEQSEGKFNVEVYSDTPYLKIPSSIVLIDEAGNRYQLTSRQYGQESRKWETRGYKIKNGKYRMEFEGLEANTRIRMVGFDNTESKSYVTPLEGTENEVYSVELEFADNAPATFAKIHMHLEKEPQAYVKSVVHNVDSKGDFYRLSEWGNLPEVNSAGYFYKLRFNFKDGSQHLTSGNPVRITTIHRYIQRQAEEIENFDVIIYESKGQFVGYEEILTIEDVPFEGPNEADRQLVKARAAVTKAERAKDRNELEEARIYLDEARVLVNALPDGEDKDSLLDRIQIVQDWIDEKLAEEEQAQIALEALEDYESRVSTKEKVLELVENDSLRQEVSALFTDVFNKIQKVKDQEKREQLLARLEKAQDRVIAAGSVKALQNATENLTKDNLDQAKLRLSNAKTNVRFLEAGEIKDALNALIEIESLRIKEFEKQDEQEQIDKEAAAQVDKLIARFKEKDEITEDYIEKVRQARAAYDELNENAKSLVHPANVGKLQRAEARIAEYEENLLLLEEAENLIEKAERAMRKGNKKRAQRLVNSAKDLLDDVADGQAKDELLSRIKTIQDWIDRKQARPTIATIIISIGKIFRSFFG